jgi:hypothetical protein
MTRRDARIMARRLGRWGWEIEIATVDGRWYLRAFDSSPGYRLIFCCPGRGVPVLLAYVGRPR